MEMEFTVKAILGICVLIILWELSAVSFTNKKIKIVGKVPGQKLGIGLFAAAAVIIMIRRWGTSAGVLLTAGSIAVAGLLNFAIKNGLSDYGVYVNGRSTPYKSIKYYDLGAQEKDGYRLRLSGRSKELELLFGEAELEQAVVKLIENRVLDMEAYKAAVRQAERQ